MLALSHKWHGQLGLDLLLVKTVLSRAEVGAGYLESTLRRCACSEADWV